MCLFINISKTLLKHLTSDFLIGKKNIFIFQTHFLNDVLRLIIPNLIFLLARWIAISNYSHSPAISAKVSFFSDTGKRKQNHVFCILGSFIQENKNFPLFFSTPLCNCNNRTRAAIMEGQAKRSHNLGWTNRTRVSSCLHSWHNSVDRCPSRVRKDRGHGRRTPYLPGK